jgi:hypothetical protein
VATHYKMLQARIIAFFHHDKMSDLKLLRKQLKKKVRGIVNTLGPQLFKNFDKLKLIMREGSSKQGSSQAHSKTDFEVNYQDELEINRAFACLKELENI